MQNFSYHVPFYVANGGVATSGASADLKGAQVGLFDRNTFSVATAVGNGTEFFFAQGHIGGKDWYGFPVTESHKSPFFLGKDVTNMYLSIPKRIVNEEWIIGYNGGPSSKSLTFEKGKATRIQFYFHGEPTYRFFGGPKTYVVSYTPTTDCTEPCSGSDCPEGITDCLTHTRTLIDLINTHTELQKFGVTAKEVTNPFSAASTNMTKWCLTLCDNGDSVALQAVQAQAPSGAVVSKTARVGALSTYQFCIEEDEEDTPDDFTQSGDVLFAVCDECPAGSTLSAAQDVYLVTRPLAGSEDLNDGTARQTFADLVGTAYENSETITFNGATAVEVVASSDAITLTAHGLSTGNKVTYADGGGTQIVGLTDTNDYYVIKVDADTIKLATTAVNAYAGTAIAISDGVGASHTLTPVITAKFIGIVGGTAQVKLKVGEGIVLDAQSADAVVQVGSQETVCTFADADPVSWEDCGSGVSSSRTLKLSCLNRTDCDGGDRLSDLTTILDGVRGVDVSTLAKVAGEGCCDDYTVDQTSNDCLSAEECLTNVTTFSYDDLPAIEGHSWEVVPEDVEENESRECGIRVTAGYFDPRFGNCSFNLNDYYETMPVKMEISLLNEDDDRCDTANWPSVQQSRVGQISRQSGEWVVRESIMKTNAYLNHIKQFDGEPRMREAFDMNLLDMVGRTSFYNVYYISYKASYGNPSNRKNEQEKFTTVFAFKEGDPARLTFESSVVDVLTAKSGVSLHVND